MAVQPDPITVNQVTPQDITITNVARVTATPTIAIVITEGMITEGMITVDMIPTATTRVNTSSVIHAFITRMRDAIITTHAQPVLKNSDS